MKHIRKIRIVYRNKFFYWMREVLPKAMTLELQANGVWRRIKGLKVGYEYDVKCKRLRPVRVIDAIVFAVLSGRKSKKDRRR